jgi:hypothetical protein
LPGRKQNFVPPYALKKSPHAHCVHPGAPPRVASVQPFERPVDPNNVTARLEYKFPGSAM